MKRQSPLKFTLNVVIPFIGLLWVLASAPSTSSLTFFENHIDASSPNYAFAQQGQSILPQQEQGQSILPQQEQGQSILPQQEQGQSILPQQEQGQSILPQQATTNPNLTQQIQEPIITPSVAPRASQAEVIGNANTSFAGPNNNTQTQTYRGVILLNQSFISEEPDDRIVGEVLNNGTTTAQFVKITASFYGINGTLLGSHMAYSEPNTIEPGNRAPFNIVVANGTSSGGAETYGLNIQWRDINGNYKSVSLIENLSLNNASGNVVNIRDACDPSYPEVCIQSPPPDLDCPQIPYVNFDVIGDDPHGLDGNNDGTGCVPNTGPGNNYGNTALEQTR